jgi:hypothetical protein
MAVPDKIIFKTTSNRKRLYPEAFKPVLVDIALVGVVVLLDAVQKVCSADPRSLLEQYMGLLG